MQHITSAKAIKAIIFCGLAIVALSFGYSHTTAVEKITQQYRQNLSDFENQLAALNTLTAQIKANPKKIENARKTFLQVRHSYKKIEFLIEYLDVQSVKDNINGAPLPKIQRSTDMKVVPPHGLQVIEELLYADDAPQQADELFAETKRILEHFKEIKSYHLKILLTERNLFEAARLQLIRITTLGITGFDTPASGNALPDAKSALLPLLQIVDAYSPQLDAALAKELTASIGGAIKYLENNTDFDTFDRFEFIKNYINPAFKQFKTAHLQLGIETIYEAQTFNQPLNYLADDIFSTDLFDVNFFSASSDKKIKPEKVALGKFLFFDPILSSNSKRSCASCHNPNKAFTDGQQRSLAMDFKGTVFRNAPTLINSVYAERYFYDLRVEKIENQFEHVITSPLEFNMSYPQIVERLSKSSEYKNLFKTAYPEFNGEISKLTVAEAIGAYLKTLTSFNSTFDKNIRGEEKTLSPQAIKGFNLFMGKAVCGTCHFAPTFSGLVPPYFNENESEVLGVPATTDTINAIVDYDIGRIGGRMREKVAIFQNSFKTVTVRNAQLTAPYMHNGVYNTFEEVVDFYNKGGGQGLGIYLDNQTLPFDHLSLTEQEKKDIIVFMNSLTDTAGLTSIPATLPKFENNTEWNKRKIGGEY